MPKKQTRASVSPLLLAGAFIALSTLFSGPANAAANPDQPRVKYELLFVSHGPDGQQVHVSKRVEGDKRKSVHKDKSAYKAIKWAIKNGRVTAILKGDYQLSQVIDIKRDDATLIVAPDVKLAHKSDKESRPAIPIIEVVRADNVRVFTFGLLEQTGTTQEAVVFDGRRKDGRTGIKGGLLFGTSEVRNMGSAYTFTGTKNIHIPFAMGSNYGQMLVGCSACFDMTIGTIAGLGTSKGEREGELIDLNSFNNNVTIDTVIGTAPMLGDEMVDINHSHNVTINRFLAFFGTGRSGRNPVGLDLYGSPGYNAAQRERLWARFKESKNIVVKYMERNHKKIAGFNKQVTLPGFPDSLPTLNVKVDLSVDFEDGITRTLIDDKNYRFDLDSK